MINVKEATKAAQYHLSDLLGADSVSDMRLEEIEMIDQGEATIDNIESWTPSYWLVTLSYLPANQNPLLSYERQRQYKVFKIKADTGDFVAMKMRDAA